MDIKIEKSVPIPVVNNKTKYGFMSDLKVGDSFVVKSYDAASYRNAMKRHGYKCVSRKETQDTHRIWRTE